MDDEQIALRALAETYKDEKLTRAVRDAARIQARQALRHELKAFASDLPEDRVTDPRFAPVFYRLPSMNEPATPQSTSRAPQTAEEKRQAIREFWTKAFLEQELTFADTHPYRVKVFYRLLRELTRLFDLLQPHELLEEIPSALDGRDPWTSHRAPPARAPRGHEALAALKSAKRVSMYPPGLFNSPKATEPAPTKDSTQEDASTSKSTYYDPAADTDLLAYLDALRSIADYLGIANGTEKEPHFGRYGLRGLLEPALVRLLVPSPQEIFLWERLLVTDTTRAVVSFGVSGALRWLQKTHGLDHVESSDLVRQAKAHAKRTLSSDTEEERAIMILRLEDFAKRARKGLSLAGELGALKQLSIVQGFGRIEPEDAVSEFVATVRRVNAEEKKPVLELEDEKIED